MKKDLDEILVDIEKALDEKDFGKIRHAFEGMAAADIAEVFEEFEDDQPILVLFRLVEHERRPHVFAYISFEHQEVLIENLSDVVVSAILNEMEPVDRTNLLAELDVDIRERLVSKMTPEERKMALELLAYPEDSVGRIMTTEFLSVKEGMRAYQAVEHIRWFGHYGDDAIHYVFVVDESGRYVGDVTLAKLIINTGEKITDLMTPAMTGLDAFSDEEHAVDHFRKYDLSISPVVDANGVIIGVVTSDDIFDVAEDEATEDIQQFGGQSNLEDPYFATPVHVLLRKRAGWLCLLFLGEFFTSAAMQHYDPVLKAMRFLIYFVPIIIASGGNSGTQAASIIIRGLAVKEMELQDWYKVFRREFVTGLCLGLILGTMAYTWGFYTHRSHMVGLTVGIALTLVVLFGAVMGAMMPFIFKRFNLDPAVSSSPFIACLVDCVGILIYLSLAQHLLMGLKVGTQ